MFILVNISKIPWKLQPEINSMLAKKRLGLWATRSIFLTWSQGNKGSYARTKCNKILLPAAAAGLLKTFASILYTVEKVNCPEWDKKSISICGLGLNMLCCFLHLEQQTKTFSFSSKHAQVPRGYPLLPWMHDISHSTPPSTLHSTVSTNFCNEAYYFICLSKTSSVLG